MYRLRFERVCVWLPPGVSSALRFSVCEFDGGERPLLDALATMLLVREGNQFIDEGISPLSIWTRMTDIIALRSLGIAGFQGRRCGGAVNRVV
jgi:hypothetical protein